VSTDGCYIHAVGVVPPKQTKQIFQRGLTINAQTRLSVVKMSLHAMIDRVLSKAPDKQERDEAGEERKNMQ